MTTLILEAPGAVIHAADTPRRTIAGRLITYGEYGRTSAGLKRIRAGALDLPADPRHVLLLRGHSDPVTGGIRDNGEGTPSGAARRLTDTLEALDAEFGVSTIPVGDVLLAEANPEAPVRGGLSVELIDVELDPADPSWVVAGRLKAVAAVPFPAYTSSRVTTVAASAHDTPGEPLVTAPATVDPTPPAAPSIDYAALAAALAPHLAPLHAAAAPAGLPAGGALPTPAAPVASPGLAPSASPAITDDDVVRRAASLQASIVRNPGSTELHAALENITNSGLDLFQNRSALGEKLWEGAGYSRSFVGLMRNKPLTDYKFTGWQWIQTPRVEDYAGDKADVPSNPVSVVAVEGRARRLAGAWDIDRKFVDFASPEFWEEFWAAGTESYLEESDARVAAAIADYAIDLETPADYPTLENDEGEVVWTYSLPAGYSTGAGNLIVPSDVLRAAALATAVLEDTPKVKRGPDYIGMHTADWLQLAEITNLDLPAFLAMLKVRPDQFVRSSSFARGRLTAGVRNAATFRELGSVPVRVEAQHIAHGGVDRGLFGYTGISMDRPGGIISLPLTTADPVV